MPTDDPALALILDAVHGALRRGDYAALPSLTAAMEAAVEDLDPMRPDEVRALRTKLERNAACLLAAARGLRAAKRRLAEIAQARAGLSTYGASGTLTRIGGPDGRIAQRF
jgi:hypothetical protein